MITSQQEAIEKMGSPYGATTSQLISLAINHWKKWRPKEAAAMEKDGSLRVHAEKAVERTQKEIRDLMDRGFQYHEAKEIVMPKYIMLKPE